MSASGRAVYRAQLVTLLAEAHAAQPGTGNPARVGAIACIEAVIAQIDAMQSPQTPQAPRSTRGLTLCCAPI